MNVLDDCLHELGRRVLLAAVCDARVMLMLNARDGHPTASDVHRMLEKIHAEGMTLYASSLAGAAEQF